LKQTAKWSVGLLVTVASLGLFWDGYFATFPVIHATRTDAQSPWNIPFIFENNSRLFRMYDMEAYCRIVTAQFIGGGIIEGMAVVTSPPNQPIEPGTSKNYHCPFESMIEPTGAPISATIRIEPIYRTRFAILWERQPTPTGFTMRETKNGYEWVEGEVLY
jgi:hypothetical protein